MADAPVRTCIGCTQTDDHPKHVVVLPGDIDVTWHLDCHVIATGCEDCTGELQGADGATGDELRAHLTTGGT